MFTTNGSPTTSVVLNTVTLHPQGQLSSDGGNSNSFWHDHGAVGGTFAAVGIVAVGLLAALGWFIYRRQKTKRMDADVVAAASAAAATTRTPFDDDDDEEMGEAAIYPQTHTEQAPFHYTPDEAASQQYYDTPGYHAPNHYASTDLPRTYPSLADDPYGSEYGGRRRNTMDYLSNTNLNVSDSPERGAYSHVPTESLYNYNQPLYDSVPGAPLQAPAPVSTPLGASTAAAYQNPFQNDLFSGPVSRENVPQRQGTLQSSHPSEHTTASTDYELAPSQMGSQVSQYTAAPETMLPYHQAPSAAASETRDASVPALDTPSTAHAPRPPAPISPFDDVAPYLGPAATQAPVPPYAPGPLPPVLSNEKVPSNAGLGAHEPTPLVQFGQPSPDSQHGSKQPFSDGDNQTEHGEWDPPALSSSWFPHGTAHTQPTALTTDMQVAQQPQQSIGHTAEAETASVEHAPTRLTVRNPSPEDEE